MKKLQEATQIEPVVIKYQFGKLVDQKFSSVLTTIFGHKTGDNHQRSDLSRTMKKFTEARKDFQSKYDELAKKYAKLDDAGKPVYEGPNLQIKEENLETFNKEAEVLFDSEVEMTFENGRKPFNAMTLEGISLSASDTVILGDFYTESF